MKYIETELTLEEYNAIMEAREYMEEKSNFNKYLNSKVNKVNDAKRKKDAYENIADTTSSHRVRAKAIEKYNKYNKEMQDNDEFEDGISREQPTLIKGSIDYARKGQHNMYSDEDIRLARRNYKNKFGGDNRETPKEKYRANRYLDAQNAIRGKKAVKEDVLDWYEENGIEIDDYEMGRIDSFVENYR